jgi:hypothetical protein
MICVIMLEVENNYSRASFRQPCKLLAGVFLLCEIRYHLNTAAISLCLNREKKQGSLLKMCSFILYPYLGLQHAAHFFHRPGYP